MSTTKQVGNNKKGVGGFGDNPENRSDGRWKKEDSISYQLHKFLAMTVEEFGEYEVKNPPSKRSQAEHIAYARVMNSRDDLSEAKELTNRTEGMPKEKKEVELTLPKPIHAGIYEHLSNGQDIQAQE